MLTQVVDRLNPPSRGRLGETLEALSVLAAPDGAAEYLGRGEGNVWVPAATAAAMIEGAALYPERAGRYLAVAEAAVARLRALHLTPDRGLLVVPGEREGSDGIDSYVHTVAYNGLALWALAVRTPGAPRRSLRRLAARSRRRVASRSPTAARGWRSSAPDEPGWRCGRSAAARATTCATASGCWR